MVEMLRVDAEVGGTPVSAATGPPDAATWAVEVATGTDSEPHATNTTTAAIMMNRPSMGDLTFFI